MKNPNSETPLVSIYCITYNHVDYIRQCLDGFVMQKTNFRYEVVIHDDASTDGTSDIVREYADKYPEIIKPIIQKENVYSKGGFELINKLVKPHLTGKYVALCEGDDYWTHPEKLQKQVDYLEVNPDCTLCYHAADIKFTEDFTGLRNIPAFCDVKNEYRFIDTIKGYPFQTATVVYRRELLDCPLYKKTTALGMGYSKILFMVATHEGRVCGFNEKWSVYRKNNGGVSNIIDTGDKAIERIEKYTEMAELFSSKEKKIMHHVYICYLIWESYVLTPFSDSVFFRFVLKEAKKSPLTAIKLIGRYVKRKISSFKK